MDELTENAEDIAEEGEKKEEVKLGRLQYKVNRIPFISSQPHPQFFSTMFFTDFIISRWSTTSTQIVYQ